jgi:1-acyl-sn-glycerol-3-phosphate acyltransferase
MRNGEVIEEGDAQEPRESPPAAEDSSHPGSEEALTRALDELRRETRARFPEKSAHGGDPAPVDWMELFDELRHRLNTFGMRERTWEVDEFGLDASGLERAEPLLDFLADRYWRIDVRGIEEVPADVPCLFVANRAGLLPYDGLMISHTVARSRPEAERPRFLVADWLVTLPFVQPFLARLGGVRACRENAERLLRGGRPVVAFPEGMKGAAKVFRERYRLQRFGRGGVVRVALAMGCPLVPVAVVGAEEAHPVLFKVETLARMAGLPFLPVTPTFPLLGPLGLLPLPTKWSVHFGSPIPTENLGVEAAQDEVLVSRMTEQLRAEIQERVNEGLHARPSVWG